MPETPRPQSPPGGHTPAPTPPSAGPVRLPSRRATALLAGTMLALGVAVGAAIGPAPTASLAGSGTIVGSVLVPYLNELQRAEQANASNASVAPAPAAATTPKRRRRRRHHRKPKTVVASAPASTVTTTTSTSTSAPSAGSTLPPITNVWLIELAGSTFTEALAQPTSAPNIDQKIIPSGALLSGSSALDGGALASEAGLLAAAQASAEATAPTLQTITEPLCPEGAAGAACGAGTPGALSAADNFLAQTLAVITASASYSAHGLVVVTFGTLGEGSATGLPSGSQTATLTSQPPAGVLLISPFVHAGARPSTTFNPTSPRQSLEKLLQR